jgi:hypothetical protein
MKMSQRRLWWFLVVLASLAAGMMMNRFFLTILAVQAQSAGQSLEILLTEKGKLKLQATNGLISTSTDRIDYKETYIVVTSRDTDRRTWILAVDDIKVISPDRQ